MVLPAANFFLAQKGIVRRNICCFVHHIQQCTQAVFVPAVLRLTCCLKVPEMMCPVSEHYADDLEVDLEAAMLQDFNVEVQDDSPRQVISRAAACILQLCTTC